MFVEIVDHSYAGSNALGLSEMCTHACLSVFSSHSFSKARARYIINVCVCICICIAMLQEETELLLDCDTLNVSEINI